MITTRRTLLGLMGAAMLAACTNTPATTTSTAYLVRHAEKQTGKDPSLTADGEARAVALVEALDGKSLSRIFSSDYARTRQTAAPIAAARGIDVELYDAGDLPAIAAKVKALNEDVLIVGHSNTTPELTELLGGDGDTPIREADEYDRLYAVTFTDGSVTTRLTRYGE